MINLDYQSRVPIYEQIVININDELKTGNALRDISNFILKELKI